MEWRAGREDFRHEGQSLQEERGFRPGREVRLGGKGEANADDWYPRYLVDGAGAAGRGMESGKVGAGSRVRENWVPWMEGEDLWLGGLAGMADRSLLVLIEGEGNQEVARWACTSCAV